MLRWPPHRQTGASPSLRPRTVVAPSGSALTALSLQLLQTAEGSLARKDSHSGLAAGCSPPPSCPLRRGPGQPVSLAKCGDDGETLGSVQVEASSWQSSGWQACVLRHVRGPGASRARRDPVSLARATQRGPAWLWLRARVLK